MKILKYEQFYHNVKFSGSDNWPIVGWQYILRH